MKQFVITCIAAIGIFMPASAQKYLDHLQQNTAGQASVKVSQSKEIDELVNGKPVVNKPATSTSSALNTPAAQQKSDSNHPKAGANTTVTDSKKDFAEHKSSSQQKDETQKKHAADSAKKAEQHESSKDKEEETTPVDMRKKVMRSSYKVTGYRVQAFAGGNSRADRQKAEQIGNAIKMRYPDQPVYVHFYSPRWICRIGNFRSLTEANAMLAKVRAMGYKQACLVKGKITVQN